MKCNWLHSKSVDHEKVQMMVKNCEQNNQFTNDSISFVFSLHLLLVRMVRPPGFEPGSSAWQADVLAKLDYSRWIWDCGLFTVCPFIFFSQVKHVRDDSTLTMIQIP